MRAICRSLIGLQGSTAATRAFLSWQALTAVGGAGVVSKYPSALTVNLEVGGPSCREGWCHYDLNYFRYVHDI